MVGVLSGLRQLGVLFRKNLLLKTRRPCATCFELSLPVVLFMLLGYTRLVYKTYYVGPFYFDNNPVFPVSRMLFAEPEPQFELVAHDKDCPAPGLTFKGMYQSAEDCGRTCNLPFNAFVWAEHGDKSCKCVFQGCELVDALNMSFYHINRESAVADVTNRLSSTGMQLLQAIERDALCADDFVTTLADTLEPLLSMNITHNVSNSMEMVTESVAQMLATLDPAREAARARDALQEMQAANITALVRSIEDARERYSNSDYPAALLRLAESLDDYVQNMSKWFDDVDMSNRTEVRRNVENLVGDLCGWNFTLPNNFTLLNLPNMSGFNLTSLDELLNLDGTALLEALLNTSSMLNTSVLEDLLNLNGNTLLGALLNSSDWSSVSWEDLSLSNFTWQSPLTGSFVGDLVSVSFKDGVLSWEWNTTALEKELEAVRTMLNSTNFTEQAVMIVDNVQQAFDTAEQMVEAINAQLAIMNSTAFLDFQMLGQNLTDLLSSTSNSMAEVEAVALVIDDLVWWISHFVRPNSSTAEMFGEYDGQPRRMVSSIEGAMEFVLGPLPQLQLERPDMSDVPGEASMFKTEMGVEMDRLMRRIRESRAMSMDFNNVTEMTNFTWSMMTAQMDFARSSFGEMNVTMQDMLTMIEDLQTSLRDMLGQNKTLADLERDMMPEFKEMWETECPAFLNKTAIADAVSREFDTRGDMYRRLADMLKNLSMANSTDELSRHVESWDFANFTDMLVEMQQEFNRSVNLTGFEKSVAEFLRNVQQQMNGTDARAVSLSLAQEMQRFYLESRNMMQCPVRTEASSITATTNDWSAWMGDSLQGLAESFLGPLAFIFEDAGGEEQDYSEDGWGDEEDEDSSSGAGDYLTNEIMRRKILVAPYVGEAKKLWDYVMVDLMHSVADDESVPSYLRPLLADPFVRGLGAKALQLFVQDRLLTFRTEAELEAYSMENSNDVLVAVVFRSCDESTGNFPAGNLEVEYAIRLHAQLLPSTSRVLRFGRNAMFGATRVSRYAYLDLGFSYLQEVMGRSTSRLRAIRQAEHEDKQKEAEGNPTNRTEVGWNMAANERTEMSRRLEVGVEQFPAPRYKMDGFIRVIQHTFPMMMIFGWIYAVSLLVKEAVYEKQERLRDVMRIMGLKTWVYWASWMFSAMVQMTVLVLIMVLIISGFQVLKFSDPTVVFAFFWVYSVATVSLAMLISAFFSRAKVAAACGGLGYYCLYMPYAMYTRFEDVMSWSGKNALCLMSSTGLGIGMAMIAKWELIEEGVQWNNLFLPPPVTNSGFAPKDDHSLGNVMMMLLIDAVLYQVLAWYIEKVFPGTLGLPQPWYFPVLPSYWRGIAPVAAQMEGEADAETVEKQGNAKIECWEQAPPGLKASVQIRDLTKTFRGGKKALQGITLDMHEGTILGLLGHNGAGKSTTMSILTGLYPPTAGDVRVNGVSVRADAHGVRKQLGVCMQHNALWENITVQEHLRLFCHLKGVPSNQLDAEVEQLLKDTGLVPKRHAPSRALSGGMKRKLSIGIALCGGSKVVTLDEPTAGVDATSRRDIWQLLATHKATKTILLSTHFMDEADILSDRIAIIAEGLLTAIGSGIYLKKHFADGYWLTIVRKDNCDSVKMLAEIKRLVPGAKCEGGRGREICFMLPFSSRAKFAALFEALQDVSRRETLGIETYGVSAPTMEEVFLKASSVHETGLKGQVRNQPLEIQDLEVQSSGTGEVPSDHGEGSGGGSTKDSSGNSNDGVKSGISDPSIQIISTPEATSETGSGSGSPDGTMTNTSNIPPLAAQAADPLQKDGPQSLHCMGAQPTPRKEDAQKSAPKVLPAERHEAIDRPMSPSKDQKKADNEVDKKQSVRLVFGPQLWMQQFYALFVKRGISVRRDRKAWASQLLLPTLFVVLALLVAKLLEVQEEEPPLKMSTDMFIGTVNAGSTTQALQEHVIPFHDEQPTDEWGTKVLNAFGGGVTNDVLKPLTLADDVRMEDFLMTHARDLPGTFGAVSVGSYATEEGTDNRRGNVTLWFRNQAYHAIPAMVNTWNNARFHMMNMEDTRMSCWNHPLPKTTQLLQEELTGASQMFTDLTVAITVILAMGFIPASFVVYLVHEKATNGKHQQLITGVGPMMYWLSSYCWDMVNFIIPLAVCVVLFLTSEAYGGSNAPAVFVLMLMYGASMTPAMYCLEPLFGVPSTAYVSLICLNIFTGTVSVMAVTVLELYQNDAPELKPLLQFMTAAFPWLMPNYCLGRGMIQIAVNHYLNYAAEEFGICINPGSDGGCTKSPFEWEVAGEFITSLFVMAPVWLFLRLMIEWGFCLRRLRMRATQLIRGGPLKAIAEDDAVKKEEERVNAALQAAGATGTVAADNLVIHNLGKTFKKRQLCSVSRAPTVHAVRGVSVGVPPGECFGLLGVNGAGKTTTMRMITGDTDIGSGDVLVSGYSVHGQRDRARQHLGYCPQFDALPDKLTVRETLALYARIRGVPSGQIAEQVESMIRRMCLEAHQTRLCEHLSGGNKRKLSTALALIGEPDVVLLDEPSTGVDVGARCFLWEVISGIRQRGHAIVLTSHSMEECEVLCTRLTIMVHGQFRCLGSPVELKDKYGGGYTLTVKVELTSDSTQNDPTEKIRAFIAREVPTANLTETSVGLLRYKLHDNGGQVPLAHVFKLLEEATSPSGELAGCASDYTVSQTSLEEVFLYFSQEAENTSQQALQEGIQAIKDEAPVEAEAVPPNPVATPGASSVEQAI